MPRIPKAGCRLSPMSLRGGKRKKANATFLVNAANSHDELIAALRAAYRQLRRAGSPDRWPVVNQVRVALEKAEI